MTTFAKIVKSTRASLNLTQAELAYKLGLSSQTINNWETGRVEPWPRKKDIILEQLRHVSDTAGIVPTQAPVPRSPAVSGTPRKRPDVNREILSEEETPSLVFQVRKPPPHE